MLMAWSTPPISVADRVGESQVDMHGAMLAV
jgi:hypothetical protein